MNEFEGRQGKGDGRLTVSPRSMSTALPNEARPVPTVGNTAEWAVADRRVVAFILAFLGPPPSSPLPMLDVGMRTIELAVDSPAIFVRLDVWMRDHIDALPPQPVLDAMRADPRLASASQEVLIRLNTTLWGLTLGLAHLAGSHAIALDRAFELLESAGEAMVDRAAGEAGA